MMLVGTTNFGYIMQITLLLGEKKNGEMEVFGVQTRLTEEKIMSTVQADDLLLV